MKHFTILANGPWYELFYSLAFLITLVILFYEGYNRKFPILKWVFLIVLTRLLFIAGTKIITFSGHDWYLLFSRFYFPQTEGKSLLGGLLFGVVGLFAGSYLLGFGRKIADAFAIVLPLGIAIQRMGCFVTGCCFGKPSFVPWAVKYPANTLPHYHQFTDNLITHSNFVSLPVHPVQFYEMVGMIASVFIVIYFRKKLKNPGSLFLLSLSLIFTVRWLSEFFRDAHAHTIGGEMMGAFNTTQLVLVPVILLLVYLFIKQEKAAPAVLRSVKDFGPGRAFILILILFLFFRTIIGWFVLPETIVLLLTFAVAFTLPGYLLIIRFSNAPYRWLYLAGFLLPLVLMAQTLPYSAQDTVVIKKYKTIKIGFGGGTINNSYDIGQGSGCDRVSETEYFKHEYRLAAAALEFSREKPLEKQKFSYGVKTIIGSHNEIRVSDNHEKDYPLVVVAPYVTLETNWVGVGGGFNAGSLSYVIENKQEEGYGRPLSGAKRLAFYPQVYLRFGPRKWFFADYHLTDHFPSSLPGFRQQIGIGTGFGTSNETNLRFGYSTNDLLYLSGNFPVNNRVAFTPTLLWGDSPPLYDKTYYQLSLGLSYRFGFSDQ